ncbi:MAG: phenylalanine--tRNA ligase subunit beta [bacterium]
MKISYNWLQSYIQEPLPSFAQLEEKIIFHMFEVEEVEHVGADIVFDIKTLPDRNHDCLSHQGVAKEIAGLLGCTFKDPTEFYKIPESSPTKLVIDMHPDTARRYMSRIVRTVTVAPSPTWVQDHLKSIGQRSINNIVDATNIVMYDCGQPCHAFDLDKIVGNITIRHAVAGEAMTTLDNKDVVLTESDIVVADDEGVLALAGVKGGKKAEVDTNTKNIVVEVANFYPNFVRKTRSRVGIFTDSAKRFENDLSPELCAFAMRELSGLFVEYGFTDFEDIVDIYPHKQEKREVVFSTGFINKKLGTNISDDEVETILKNYGYVYEKVSPKSLLEKSSDLLALLGQTFSNSDFVYILTVPELRFDIAIPEDMVDEIGRVYGYDKVVPVVPQLDFVPQKNPVYESMKNARDILLAREYKEVMTYGFADKGEVRVLNSASNKTALRANLTDGVKRAYELNKGNVALLGLNEIKIFEIGTVFTKEKEEIHICFNLKKEIKEMSLEEFNTMFSSEESILQVFGSPRFARPDHSEYLSSFEKIEGVKKFKMWSVYPFIVRDIAFWADEKSYEAFIAVGDSFASKYCVVPMKMFDSFSKEDKTSYAFRFIFQSFEKTLTDAEVEVWWQELLADIAHISGITVR